MAKFRARMLMGDPITIDWTDLGEHVVSDAEGKLYRAVVDELRSEKFCECSAIDLHLYRHIAKKNPDAAHHFRLEEAHALLKVLGVDVQSLEVIAQGVADLP